MYVLFGVGYREQVNLLLHGQVMKFWEPCIQVDNQHARLHRSLRLTSMQQANMARVWREWCRRKRGLDRQQDAAVATLSSNAHPLPPADSIIIEAIAEGALPLSHGQRPSPASEVRSSGDSQLSTAEQISVDSLPDPRCSQRHTPHVFTAEEVKESCEDKTSLAGCSVDRSTEEISVVALASCTQGRSNPQHNGTCPAGTSIQGEGCHASDSGPTLSGDAEMHAPEEPPNPSAASQRVAWPGFAGQCAYTTTALNTALEELRVVRSSHGRLYENYIELRMHPSEILDAKQLMMISSDHLKLTCPPADTLKLCEMSYLQLSREALFEGIGALAL